MRHTISVLVENKFGVLTRVAGLFSGRGYNIDTLNVGPTQDPDLSRMTIVTHGDEATLEQIVKQLNKLPNAIKVQDFRDGEYVDRELVLRPLLRPRHPDRLPRRAHAAPGLRGLQLQGRPERGAGVRAGARSRADHLSDIVHRRARGRPPARNPFATESTESTKIHGDRRCARNRVGKRCNCGSFWWARGARCIRGTHLRQGTTTRGR